MCPFPGAIGWFWMHGAGILPSRAVFRAEGPEIMHSVKMLPALLGLFVTAACSLVERALCPIAQTWLARRMSAPLRFWSRSPPSHPASLRSLSCPPDSRPAARTAPELASLKTQNARPAPRTRHRALSAMRSPPIATRRTSPRRAGAAAVPAIPAKWCGDTIAHTRKLRF